ncbi:DUF1043 family protein, partial [Salmonella enterica subsp. enterica serovar Anatum]|nr:DUF1043 family protein [Salmonella enterica subsp. enterica serovar Anatum]
MTWEYALIGLVVGIIIGAVAMRFGNRKLRQQQALQYELKVSTSASAAWKAVLMALDDTAVTGNEGIVAHNVEQSIANLCS